jgi:anti-anti-sigma regulatory factor
MVLFGMKEKVANTFVILGLADLLQIRSSKEEAKKLINELSV